MQICFDSATKDYLCRFHEILEEMIEKMTAVEPTCSISCDFILQMIPHHEAAIEMSRNLLQYPVCPPLEEIAQGIIAEQTESIRQMQEALPVCSEKQNCFCHTCLYTRRFQTIANTMFARMKNACKDNCIDANFMREMIPHHMGAIQMSENALQFCICPELVPILRAIITSQKRGVAQMERLLRCM